MLRAIKELMKKLFGRHPADPPRDPYAPVGAPKKPKRPQLNGAVALVEPEEE